MKKIEMDFKGISKKIAKIKRIYKLLFTLALNTLIFALLFYFIINPQLETKRQLENDYAKVKKELQKMVSIKNNMQKFRQEYALMQEQLQLMLKQLPETKDIPNLLRNVSNIGSETRLKITYFEPGTLQNKEFFAELPFSIKYSGPYHNIGYFFDGIRKLERIINITNFNLSYSAKASPARMILNGDCVAKTYVYLNEPPKPVKKK